MSTLKAFILTVNNQKYAIPVNAIKYVKYVKNSEILYNNGTKSIIFEGHSIPLYSLSEIFEGNCKIASEDFLITVIIIEFAGKQSAFIVDKLLGDQEVFHKKLIAPIIKIKNISGFTTLSTGEICLIINPYELMRNTSSKNAQFVFEYKSNSLQDKQSALASQKTLILNDENGKLNQIKNDLSDCIDNICEFNNINSIYDYIQKNETDILICNINTLDDEAIRLIRYLKSDENYNGIKIIIFSELPEYELNEQLKDYKYSHFENILKYNKEDFINKLYEIIG